MDTKTVTHKVSTSKRRTRKTCVGYRHLIIFLLATCAMISYCTRISFKLSLRHMTKPRIRETNDSVRCDTGANLNYTFVPVTEKQFPWPKKFLPLYSECFIWAYIISHFPAGVISVRNGGKTLLTVALLIFCGFTFLTPFILFYVTESPYYVFIYRTIAGLCCGVSVPCFNTILANWTPPRDRTKMASILFAGNSVAAAINLLFGNMMIVKTNTWSCLYYFYGSFLITWIFFWHRYGSSYYKNNSRVSRREYRYLEEKMADVITFSPKAIPWWKMMKSLPLWALAISEFGHQCIFRLVTKELPHFLREALGIETNRAYILCSIPFLLMGFFTIVIGFLSDFLINRDYVHVTTYRKICTTIGAMGPSLNFVTAYYAGCNRNTAIFMLFFGICLMSFYYSGTRVNTLDLAPNFSGMVIAITSGFGSLSGVFSVMILKYFDLRHNFGGWGRLFWINLALVALTNIVFSIFGSGEVQPWDQVEKTEEVEMQPIHIHKGEPPRFAENVKSRQTSRVRLAE